MIDTSPEPRSQLRAALNCSWPAMLIAVLLISPFLNMPFTIDDPVFMREAEHLLLDPLHPQALNIVWSFDLNLRASEILPGGIAAPYVLLPTALAGSVEWAGHLTELTLLAVTLLMTSLLALRLGFSRQQARFAAILTAVTPAVLGMAGTVMPDIPAMLFVLLGMERIVVWREERKAHHAVLAVFWLSLAALTRTHTIVALVPAGVLLLDGITGPEIRASFRRFRIRFLPILLAPLMCLAAIVLTADPEPGGQNILPALLSKHLLMHRAAHNLFAFLSHWTLVIPLTIPWLVLRAHRLRPVVLLISFLAAAGLYYSIQWEALPVMASTLMLADILRLSIERRDRVWLALWLWLFLAVPVVLYIQLPSKYLLPSVPAAAILVVALMPENRPEIVRWLAPAVTVISAAMGLLILLGGRDLAETQRGAVTALIEPYAQMGKRVWFSGHWGFQWYAEHAGALPVTLDSTRLGHGDIVVVSMIDYPLFAMHAPAHEVLQRVPYTGDGIGRVMDAYANTGFYSSAFGYLPWHWGAGQASRFEVWRMD